MSQSTTSLTQQYRLYQELDWKPLQKQALSPNSQFYFNIYAFDFAIIHRIQHVIDFFFDHYKSTSFPNTPTTSRKLTPLHIAVIAENVDTAEKLIKAGVDVNATDYQDWTPLHHAALAGHQVLIDLLLTAKADKNLLTATDATYQDIITLSTPPKNSPDDKIALLWKNENGEISHLTHKKFTELTRAEFIEENRFSRQLLVALWVTPEPIKNELPWSKKYRQLYQEFLKNKPTHVLARVTHNASGEKLAQSPGLGLFAHRAFKAGEILGEYRGEINDDERYSPYGLGNCDALNLRNEIPHINDGFNNCVLIPIHNVEGSPRRRMLVAAESIPAGAEFLWNYGPQEVKLIPSVELRPKEAREFIKREKIGELAECLETLKRGENQSFQDFVRAEKFRYILETPFNLFRMVFDGSIEAGKAAELLRFAVDFDCIHSAAIEPLKSLPDVAHKSKTHKDLFARFFPKMASVYTPYVQNLPSRTRTLFAFVIIFQINNLLAKKIGELENEPKENSAADTELLSFWNTKVIPSSELFLSRLESMGPLVQK